MGNDRDTLIDTKIKYYNNIFVDSIRNINSYIFQSYTATGYQYQYTTTSSYDNIEKFINEYHNIKKYFFLTENPISYINVYLNFVDYIKNYIFYNSIYLDHQLELIVLELKRFSAQKEKIE